MKNKAVNIPIGFEKIKMVMINQTNGLCRLSQSLASTYVFTKESRRSIYVAFKNNLAGEGTYSIPKFVKFKRQMKERNEGRFLIETGFLDTRSYFLATNQNARLTAYNQSKFV